MNETPTIKDAKEVLRKDEYLGQYKDDAQSKSEEERFGMNQNPVQNDALPAKNLKSVGG